ncbi:hypothetical protein [Flaviaesturariibacter amylovorans]|uniref:Nuclear transport factor 2 family protein n=1 Tax=Flaviaesturariibacter amylovorans TaxID=1084520 RepID=A0ABP8GK50_9BACT
MIFDQLSFHDAAILKVVEESSTQTLDFYLDFPLDWEQGIFEHRILRFRNAIYYAKQEIPFSGAPTILEIRESQLEKHVYRLADGTILTSQYKVEMETNCGRWTIEYDSAELLGP